MIDVSSLAAGVVIGAILSVIAGIIFTVPGKLRDPWYVVWPAPAFTGELEVCGPFPSRRLARTIVRGRKTVGYVARRGMVMRGNPNA